MLTSLVQATLDLSPLVDRVLDPVGQCRTRNCWLLPRRYHRPVLRTSLPDSLIYDPNDPGASSLLPSPTLYYTSRPIRTKERSTE